MKFTHFKPHDRRILCNLRIEFRIGKYQEWTVVYIPKTEEELGDDAKSAVSMSKLASPVSRGGLRKEVFDEVGKDVQTLMRRMSLRQGVR